MLINQGLSGSSMVVTPQARIEWIADGPRDMYLLYDQAHYIESSTPEGWQRTLALDPYHWMRLSGASNIAPSEALYTILQQPNRPTFSLPSLTVALFLARAVQPDTLEQRQLFRWVASAIPHVRLCLPAGSLQAGWNDVAGDTVEHALPTLISGLLQHDSQVPWVLSDGAWLQILDHLSDNLWKFPPYSMRAIGLAVATVPEDHAAHVIDQHPGRLDAVTALGYLSAIRFWREPWPTIRGLPIRTSMLEFLSLWHQALVITDPNAPEITDTQLAWLCDGMVGGPSDSPFDHLIIAIEECEPWDASPPEWEEAIATLRQEMARGIQQPGGSWEVQQTTQWPALSAYHVATMRLVAGPQGYWVRLIPADECWGSVLWWQPDPLPPACWSLAFGESLTSVPLMALHATFWQIWRNLQVDGCPSSEAIRII